jgi:hypothetical protein
MLDFGRIDGWPQRTNYPRPNAQQVEEAFAAKLAAIPVQSAKTGEAAAKRGDQSLAEKTAAPPIDKSVLGFPEPRRLRDRHHI